MGSVSAVLALGGTGSLKRSVNSSIGGVDAAGEPGISEEWAVEGIDSDALDKRVPSTRKVTVRGPGLGFFSLPLDVRVGSSGVGVE